MRCMIGTRSVCWVPGVSWLNLLSPVRLFMLKLNTCSQHNIIMVVFSSE